MTDLSTLARVTAERDEARAQLAAISDIVGPDMVSRDGGPAVEEEAPVVERVRALRHAASAEAEEADRLRGELARVRHVLTDVVGCYTEQGHPGRPCVRSGWVTVEQVTLWRTAAGVVR